MATIYFSGCKEKPDGNYIVYDSKPDFKTFGVIDRARSHNDSIETQLKNDLIGKKFNVKFDDDYLTLGNINNSFNDILLKKNFGSDSTLNYYGEKVEGNIKFEFTMLTNSTNILMLNVACIITIPHDSGRYQGYGDLLLSKYRKSGNLVVWLKKIQ